MMTVRTSPHIHGSLRTDKAMLMVVIALLPAALWGVWSFGLRALFVLIVSIVGALLTEYLLGKVSKEFTLRDGSALVTGLLVGMNMPPLEFHQFYIPLIASAFAIGVVKWTFGGLGCNWMNPALAGRVFVFFSFTSQMSTFRTPRVFLSDAVTSATPLSAMKTAMSAGGAGRSSDLLTLPVTDFAASLSDKLGISPYAVDAFFGNVGGCIGEVSALLLLAGGIFLLCMKIITWRIPVVYIGSFAVLSWVFGGIPYGLGAFHGEILLPVFSGGLMLGAFFMATDWVTTPTTPKGEIIFAFGCGFFTFLIRYFGALPEGVSLAIILMNIITPTIERFVKTKHFGYVKPEKKAKEAKA